MYGQNHLQTEQVFYCPSQKTQGSGSPTSRHWYGDYCIGWYSGDDIWWGGQCGLRLKRQDGSIYTPEGGGWNIGCASDPPYYPFTFAPSLRKYKTEWVYGPSWAARTHGARIFLADVVTRGEALNGINPHDGIANITLLDGHVESQQEAFADWMMAWNNSYCNEKPHHEYGQDWWAYMTNLVKQ